MLKPSDVLDGLSPAEALSKLVDSKGDWQPTVGTSDACSTTNRSGPHPVINDSDWTVDIMFMQMKSTWPQQPPGYTKDTGTFVAITNLAAHRSDSVDPCRAGGRNQPILGTWMQYSAKVSINWYGQVYHDQLTSTYTSKPGEVFGKGPIRFSNRPSSLGENGAPPAPELMITFDAYIPR